MNKKKKEAILELLFVLFLMALFSLVMVYFVKAGDCQNRAKYEGNYNEDTPFECMKFKNLKGEK